MILAASSWGFDLTEFPTVWETILQISLILLFLLIGNTLRRVIPFLRKAFIPSALIGGFLLLLVNIFSTKVFSYSLINVRLMQVITYHALAIGFIAMTLKTLKPKGSKGNTAQVIANGGLTGGTYMLQAIVGLGVSLLFFALGSGLFYDAGIILPLGFGQGPGNALTWDINFTNMESNNFDGGGSFGLTIASIGFIVASLVGVLYINYYKRKGKIPDRIKNDFKAVEHFEGENEIEDSDSVDKTTIQIAFIALSYLLAFFIMFGLAKLSEVTGVALFNSIAWGFNFIFGVITATLVKGLLKFLRKKNVVKKDYINNFQMDRISGFAFDVMIVAGVAAIDIEIVAKYAWLIIVLCIVGTIVTFFYVKLISKLCFKDIEHESFLLNFGTLTGTASNGMILLREIDPNFETPMSNIYILSQFPAMLFVVPLLLLLNMSASSLTKCLICLGIFVVLFIIYTIILILIGKGKLFRHKEIKDEQGTDQSN